MLMTTLKGVRVSRNLKIKDVAKKLNISEDTLRNYENFKTYPDIKTLKKLLEVYDVNINCIALTPEEAEIGSNGCSK